MLTKAKPKNNQSISIALVLWLCLISPVFANLFPYQAEVLKIEDLTHDVKRVRLKLVNAEGFFFTPGQYVFLKVPDDYVKEWNDRYKTAHEQVSRPYSFASSPSQLPFFDWIIKHAPAPPGKDVPPGLASTYVHHGLKVGEVVRVSQPTGTLYLRKDDGRPILVVAGGSGAAPFVCLLEYWFENNLNEKNTIFFFFGVRSKRDLFLHQQFIEWARKKKNFHYIPALSHPQETDDWKGEIGYIQLVLDKYIAGPSEADAYLAGPPIMLQEVVKVLETKGITKERIHFDEIQAR